MHQDESHATCRRCLGQCRLETDLFCWARQSAGVGRQHASRIGFSVAADINSDVGEIYFLDWGLTKTILPLM
jgi:hypothetical protein